MALLGLFLFVPCLPIKSHEKSEFFSNIFAIIKTGLLYVRHTKEDHVNKKRRPRSIREYITVALAALSVLTLLLILLCLWFVGKENRAQISGTAKAYLQLLTNTLQNQMSAAEEYITNEVLNGEDLHRLGFATNKTRAYLDGYRVRNGFAGILAMGAGDMALYLYSVPNGLLMSEYSGVYEGNPGETDLQRLAMEEFLCNAVDEGVFREHEWAAYTVSGQTYWVWGEHYYGAWLAVTVNLNTQAEQAEGGLLAFSTQSGKLLAGERPPQEELSRYVVLQDTVSDLVVEYYALLPEVDINMALLMMLGLTLAALGVLTTVSFYLQHNVVRPLEQLTDTMACVASGDLTARATCDDGSRELRQVKESLNTMLREIETLKIEQYEKSLEAERYELAALKMQIRPHFFLNSLKLIYAMAETGETNQIQTMILLLAKHLRAVLDYNRRSITLHEEAELCQNYIELTTIGQPDERACCSAEIERGLEDFLLPPLSLLSLVENSVKHAGRSDRALAVQITAKTLPIDNGRLVYIQVRDSGPGFAPDILQELNKGDSAPAGPWGLNNIRRQCALLYGPEFAMTFTNAAAGGAVVELYIPQTDTLPTADKEDSAHETVDCG